MRAHGFRSGHVAAALLLMATTLLLMATTLLLLSVALSAAATAQPRILYVSVDDPAAADGNPGTMALPWKTLEHAASQAMPGDTVKIRGGVYHEQLVTQRSGNPGGENIVFMGHLGEHAVIDGAGVTTGNNGVVITHSFISVGLLEVRNWNDCAFWVDGAGWVLICSCEAHDVGGGYGFGNGAHDFIVCTCTAHHFDLYGYDASPSGGASCFSGLFRNSMAYSGRDSTQNVDGFALGHGMQHDFVLENCTVWDVYDGFDMSADETLLDRCVAHDCWNSGWKIWAENVRLVNCLSWRHQSACVELDWNQTPGVVSLSNCTLYGADTYGIRVENSGDTLALRNCIIAGCRNIGIIYEQPDVSTYKGDYNLFQSANPDRLISVAFDREFGLDSLSAWTAFSGQDTHSFFIASDSGLFTDAAAGDFHLAASSAAIDRGVAFQSPAMDFEGKPRPFGSAVDIGAYEFRGATGICALHAPASFGVYVYPNPARGTQQILLTGGDASSAIVSVYDALGRCIRTLRGAGSLRVWDGLDACGRNVPAGLYVITVAAGNASAAALAVRIW